MLKPPPGADCSRSAVQCLMAMACCFTAIAGAGLRQRIARSISRWSLIGCARGREQSNRPEQAIAEARLVIANVVAMILVWRLFKP